MRALDEPLSDPELDELEGFLASDLVPQDCMDLEMLDGFLTAASLVWQASGLTTTRFIADTQINETTVPGVSGVLTHTYTAEVDHDFRRWLTAIGRFTWGTQQYQGDDRFDRFYSLSGDLIYKLSRTLWLKGTLRRDWLDSNQPGNSTASTVMMLGVRLQHLGGHPSPLWGGWRAAPGGGSARQCAENLFA